MATAATARNRSARRTAPLAVVAAAALVGASLQDKINSLSPAEQEELKALFGVPKQVETPKSETRVSLGSRFTLAEVFPQNGEITPAYRRAFRFNKMSGGAVALRRAIFTKVANAQKDELMALGLAARKAIFALIKGETQRWHGSAVRSVDSEYGKKGEPLPRLEFESKAEAMGYRTLLTRAMDSMCLAVYGKVPTRGQGQIVETEG